MQRLTGKRRSLIGMVHVGALPGTPQASQPVSQLATRARAEAVALRDAGYDAVMIENMHDRPYLRNTVGPEVVAGMAVVAAAVSEAIDIPCGIQILAAANKEAMAVALATGLRFIRAEAFTYAHVADEGFIDASAGALLRYRSALRADDSLLVMADIQKKHAAHAITADVPIAECARTVEYCRGDAVIVTGTHTGAAASAADLDAVRAATSLPLVVGSGATPEMMLRYRHADAVIVGSWIKVDGDWRNAVCPSRARELAREFHASSSPNPGGPATHASADADTDNMAF